MALVKCEQCGQMISDKAQICPKCGWCVETHNSESQQENSKQPNDSKGVMCFAIVAAILIVCGIIFTCIYGSKNNALLTETPTTDSTATEVEEVAAKEVVPPTPSKTDLQQMGFKGKVKEIIYMYYESGYSYSFDQNGNLTTCSNSEETFNFNQKGELISSNGVERENEFDDDGTPYGYTYTYEKQSDNKTAIYGIDTYSSEKSKYADLYYDDKGRIVKIHFFRKDAPSEDTIEIHYDSENNAYDKDNNPIVVKCALAIWMQHINSSQFTKSHDAGDKKEWWNGQSDMEDLSVHYW